MKDEINVVFCGKPSQELYRLFLTEIFNIALIELIPPKRQKETVRSLVNEGFVNLK